MRQVSRRAYPMAATVAVLPDDAAAGDAADPGDVGRYLRELGDATDG